MKGPERKHKKGACEVISLRGWKEGKKLEETLENGLFYQTLLAEERRDKEEENPRHFEIAYSISAEEFSDEERFIQIGEEEIFPPITDQGENNLMPFTKQVVERYEFYDLNTDDIHIVYRIPKKPPIR